MIDEFFPYQIYKSHRNLSTNFIYKTENVCILTLELLHNLFSSLQLSNIELRGFAYFSYVTIDQNLKIDFLIHYVSFFILGHIYSNNSAGTGIL